MSVRDAAALPAEPNRRVDEIVEQILDLFLTDNPPSLADLTHAHPEWLPELETAYPLAQRLWTAIQCGEAERAANLEQATRESRMSPSEFAAQVASHDLHQSLVEPQFAPGALIAHRYRIQGLIGVGGMGLVYRASDLKLGESVALKFLPERWSANPAALAYLRNEVRLAHQVSHVNVCRVHDIGEANGCHFLSMEYIEGENLRQLMKRMGPLPFHLSLRIARQICAGVAAAHEQGIVHRDLKPANVMVDGRGNARVTDFGLAQSQLAANASTTAQVAGTREYLAPERLRGEAADVRSDVYSLGLVLSELFASAPMRAAGEGRQVAECLNACLALQPEKRPANARAVLSLLPGSDLPEKADQDTDTPTAEIVAAANLPARISRRLATALVLAALLSLAAGFPLSQRIRLVEHAQLPRSPDQLFAIAQRVGDRLSATPTDAAAHVASGFRYARAAFLNDPSQADDEVLYWWRRAPSTILPLYFNIADDTSARASFSNPPLDQPEMLRVSLFPDGRLQSFEQQLAQHVQRPAAVSVSIDELFEAAGLPRADYRLVSGSLAEAQPHRTGDFVWQSGAAGARHVKATFVADHLLRFEVTNVADESRLGDVIPGRGYYARLFDTSLLFVLFAVSIVVLYRNAKAGRCDFAGANRFALLVFVSHLATCLLRCDWHANVAELYSLLRWTFIEAVVASGFLWVEYVAAEPLLRRAWPRLVCSWKRALSGRLSDPIVARDILIGLTTTCVGIAVLGGGHDFLRSRMAWPDRYDIPPGSLVMLLSWRHALAVFPASVYVGTEFSFTMLLLPVFLNVFLRRTWLAIAVSYLIVTLFLTVFFGNGAEWWAPYMAVWVAVFMGITFRFGLLSSVVMNSTLQILCDLPCTMRWDTWYAMYALGGAIVLALAIVVCGQLACRGNHVLPPATPGPG